MMKKLQKQFKIKKKIQIFLKSVNNGFILYEYSVCLLHFYEPEGKLGNKYGLLNRERKIR